MQHQHFLIKIKAPKTEKEENGALVLRFVKNVIGNEGDPVALESAFPRFGEFEMTRKYPF